MHKIYFLLILTGLLSVSVVFAQGRGGLDTAGGISGLTSTAIAKAGDVSGATGLILSQAILYLGIVFFLLTLYSGFLWLTAGGNDSQVGKAKSILIAAISGLVIVIAAYAIVNFVFGRVLTSAGCAREGGECKAVDEWNKIKGTTKDGLCPGDQGYKCCIPPKK